MAEPEETKEVCDSWRVDWEDSRADHLDLWLSATPEQRLAWLEEMIRLAWRSGALPRERPALPPNDRSIPGSDSST
ncbi:MAG: hypothetical protein HYZ53_04470 [Planctomycetes bacterium]|nr:hypothetical protein [Planctomycetota bacterium]